jgi:glycosyltransferase involved in cell wall biosynthesis
VEKVLLIGTLTSKLNGSARSFVKLGRAIEENGVQVTSIVPDEQGVYGDCKQDHSSVYVKEIMPLRRNLMRVLSIPIYMYRFFRFLKNKKITKVHINDIPWFYLIPICLLLNIQVTIHSRYIETNPYIRKMIKYILSKAHAVLFVSEYNKKLWSYEQENGVVINNPGIYLSSNASENSIKALANVKTYFLIVSRISEDKGILESIKLFKMFSDVHSYLKLVIAGDCQYDYQQVYKDKCIELIKLLGLEENIIWLGIIEDTDILYEKTACYIHMPNFEDPFPTTIMESLIHGCPIITVRKGGIPEQIKGFDGVFFNDEMPMIMAEKNCANILSKDKYDRKELYYKRFGWDNFVRKVSFSVLNIKD